MYYILDRDGNYIKSYKTTIEASKEFETTANVFSRCSKNIELKVRGLKPKTGAIAVKELVCVKKDIYDKHESKIREILTKDDILVINKKGVIVGTYKTISDAYNAIRNKEAITSMSNVSRVLNRIDREAYGYRLATREYYISQVQKDPICYMREYDNKGGMTKVAVDMYNIETDKYVRSFNSLTEAAEYFGCTKENIRQCVQTGRPVLKSNYYIKESE